MKHISFSSIILISVHLTCIFAQRKRCRHLTINGVTKRHCIDVKPLGVRSSLRPSKYLFQNYPSNPFDFMSIFVDGSNDALLEPNDEIDAEQTKEDENGDTCGLRVGIKTGGRIVGGRRAYKNEFPWMVGIQYKGSEDDQFNIRGGGTILNKRWVITAAHVFDGDYNASHYNGILDTLSTKEASITVFFDKIIPYPKYDNRARNYRHDIALLHTTEDMQLYPAHSGVNSVCLPNASKKFNGVVTVSGYGNVNDESTPTDRLMTVNLLILEDHICRRAFRRLYNRQFQICAGYLLGNRDSCNGDSGGPLVKFVNKRAYLVGIVSFGEDRSCGRKGSGAVYTKVTYYLNWIDENTKLT